MAEDAKITVEQIAKALKQLSGFEGAGEGFPHVDESLKSAKEAYKAHQGLVETAKAYLEHDAITQPHTELKDGVKVLKEGTIDPKITEAFDKFKAAEKKLEVLSNNKDAAKHLETLSGKLGGSFGRVHSHGGFTSKGLKNTLHGHFIDDFKHSKGRVFMRGAAVTFGAVGLVDSLFRSTTSDGEDRSLIVRGAELGICTTGIALALLAGKAKIPQAMAK
jgi:hypothetical protein